MKAIVITRPGGPDVLQLEDRPKPKAGAGEVLIRVKAAGVNRPDVFQRKGNYPPPPGASRDIPGLEVAGIIEETGPGVRRWRAGDAVCALATGGGYAEYIALPEGQCLPLPDGWNFIEAASLPETVFTVWYNVFQRGALRPGEHFLVHGGSGGIGITAIQLAKVFGARVFTTAGSAEKCAFCTGLGADRAIDYHQEDFVQVLKEEGVDLILDSIGGDYLPKNIELLRSDGRLVIINAMKGEIGEINARKIMSRRLTITGSMLRPRDTEFKARLAAEIERTVWPVAARRAFRPVIFAVFPLGEASGAHALMESGDLMGKIVLTVD